MTDAAVANPAHDFIAKTVADHAVVLFMKGEPEQPRCGFSAQVVQILDHLGVDFVGVDVLQSEALRDGVKSYTDWPTIPQLYVKGEFVGGCDIIREMFQAGELKTLMDDQGLLAS
ncbi:MAG: Grx4 family monothiol glutaredoxin [Caulobacter sp.]|nr:Grx4 family monothiol glutaredoxin [Caulobacter sp.]